MGKFVGVIVGGLEIAVGAVLIATGVGAPIGAFLINAGIGTLISGIGTLLSKGPLTGSVTSEKNPIAPWQICYGQNCVGGTPVYINSWGDNDKYLDMVIVLAAHSCQDIYALRFDGQRIQIDTTAVPDGVGPSVFPAINGGTSFTPVQQTIPCGGSISRYNNVVTVYLAQNIPLLVVGDYIIISGVNDLLGHASDVNGKWQVSNIVSQIFGTGSPPSPGSIVFQFISGGDGIVLGLTSGGNVKTAWPDYGRKIYMETMLGTQVLGQTFQGLLNGTPADGDTGSIIFPPTQNWTANCSLQGKPAVYLRLHYNDVYFSNGLPQISFLLHGKNDIYDPRTSPPSYGYSNNAALCTADFLAQGATALPSSPPEVLVPKWGFGAHYGTEIPIPQLILAANICDEQVQMASTIAGGPDVDFSYQTENRYMCDGHFPLTMKRGEILQNMLTSMAGRITYENGQFVIWPAAWQGGGTSNTPQLAANYCLWGALCFAPDGYSPGTAYGVVLSSFYVGKGPLTITVPDFPIPVSLDRASRPDPPNPVNTPYPDQYVCQLQLGVNNIFGTPSLSAGSWSITVTVNGVPTTVIIGPNTTNWYTLHGPTGGTTNLDVDIASGGVDPGVVLCGPGDTVTIEWSGGTLTPNSLLFPFCDANGDTASPVVNPFRPFTPCHWVITIYNGPQVTAPSPLPTIAGPVKWVPKRSYRDLFNGVKGTYISPANDWQSSDFPPYCQDGTHGYTWSTAEFENDQNLQDDGGDRLWKDIQLPFTISYSAAQRIAKIELLRNRYQGTGTIKFNMWGYQLTALDILVFSFPFLNFNAKLLEVQKMRFLLEKTPEDPNGAIALSTEVDVQETDPSIYEWTPFEQLGPQGYQESTLPTTTPNPAVVFLQAYMQTGINNQVTQSDGVARPAIQLVWPAPTDGWMTNGGHVEIQYAICTPPDPDPLEMQYNGPGADPLYTSPPANPPWITLPETTPFVSSYKVDIEMDLISWYRFQIRFVNAAGVPSTWTDIYNPDLSVLPVHAVIAVQPFGSPTQPGLQPNAAFNGTL